MVRQRADAERTDPIDRDWAAGARPTKAADSRHEQIQWGTLNESHRQFSPCEMHLPQVVEGKRLLLAFAASASRIRLWAVCRSSYSCKNLIRLMEGPTQVRRNSFMFSSNIAYWARLADGACWLLATPAACRVHWHGSG
jgi:hypothetical protein